MTSWSREASYIDLQRTFFIKPEHTSAHLVQSLFDEPGKGEPTWHISGVRAEEVMLYFTQAMVADMNITPTWHHTVKKEC